MLDPRFKPAMKALLSYYEGNETAKFKGESVSRNCPLCEVAIRGVWKNASYEERAQFVSILNDENVASSCSPCLWIQIMKSGCVTYAREHYTPVEIGAMTSSPMRLKQNYNGPWVEDRIKQLKEWLNHENQKAF